MYFWRLPLETYPYYAEADLPNWVRQRIQTDLSVTLIADRPHQRNTLNRRDLSFADLRGTNVHQQHQVQAMLAGMACRAGGWLNRCLRNLRLPQLGEAKDWELQQDRKLKTR